MRDFTPEGVDTPDVFDEPLGGFKLWRCDGPTGEGCGQLLFWAPDGCPSCGQDTPTEVGGVGDAQPDPCPDCHGTGVGELAEWHGVPMVMVCDTCAGTGIHTDDEED
jgi:DnaJ-class molecular chaperone